MSWTQPTKRIWVYIGVGCATAAVVGLVAVVVFWLPRIIAQNDVGHAAFGTLTVDKQGSAVNSVRTTLLQALAGLVLVIGASFTARQLRITKEGQVTDRYTKAIDQLGKGGDDNLDVRIGGIYALERIAKDSKADRTTIVEVLAAFVRSHVPLPSGANALDMEPEHVLQMLGRRAADVQIAMTILGRLRRPLGLTVDLGLVDLAWVDLADADLDGAILFGSRLERAYLPGTSLRRADLRSANLRRANLTDANLNGADLAEANLRNANLVGARLVGANLSGATYDLDTRWSIGFDPNEAGAILHPSNTPERP